MQDLACKLKLADLCPKVKTVTLGQLKNKTNLQRHRASVSEFAYIYSTALNEPKLSPTYPISLAGESSSLASIGSSFPSWSKWMEERWVATSARSQG